MNALFSFLLAIFKTFFGAKSANPVISIKSANQSAEVSARAAKHVSADNYKDLNRVETETASDLKRLDAADSLRERAEIVRDAVKRANAEPGPHN